MSEPVYEVGASVWLDTTYRKNLSPDPRTSVAEMRARAAESRAQREAWAAELKRDGCGVLDVSRQISQRFGAPRAVRAAEAAGQMPSNGSWNWYDARFMIAECLGAPPPEWDDQTHSWWQGREHYLDWVQTAADVRRIPVPDWSGSEPARKMIESHARWMEAFPDDGGGWGVTYYLILPGGRPVNSINYPAFVDLGIFLMGTTRFLEMVGGEREMADALMDKCFELGSSYTEWVLSLKPEPWTGLCGFGGDVTCMLGPRLFERYGLAWDTRLYEYVQRVHGIPDDLPCNYHSCGPSVHLYKRWAQHPYRRNIATLQTRLLPGHMSELRAALPDTYLQMTIHPQHFDLLERSSAEVHDEIWQTAEAAGFRDLSITLIVAAHAPSDLPKIEQNLQVAYDTLEEIEAHIRRSLCPSNPAS